MTRVMVEPPRPAPIPAPGSPTPSHLSRWPRRFYWGARYKLARWRRAWLYATDRLGRDSATRIIWDCQDAAEWWPLEVITLDEVAEDAANRWEDFPELREIASHACQRVYSKWGSIGDVQSAAIDWATDLMADYAHDRNIALLRKQEDE